MISDIHLINANIQTFIKLFEAFRSINFYFIN